MSFEAFYLDIVKCRSNKKTVLSKPAVLVIYDWIISHKVNFDNDKSFKNFVNSIRVESISNLEYELNRSFFDREDLASHIESEGDCYFIGVADGSVVYGYDPSSEE